MIDMTMKLNDMERRGVISNYKKIDKNAKFYTEMKNNHQDEIKNKLLFVNMMTYNITSTICLVSYDKTILFPVIGLQFIKYVEEIKSTIGNGVIEVKSNFEEYLRGNFKINDPTILEIVDLGRKIA